MPDQPTIRIFKPGTFTDIHGTKVTFERADLARIVESYDAAADPAPLVVGHPKTDDPAWGWVGELSLDGDVIVARPREIAPEFAEAVRGGRYRKVSASFYPPAHPANPKPGAWYLKHVGFLGAAAPAVKGLGTVAFSEAEEATAFTLPFAEEPAVADENTADFAEREAGLATRETELNDREAALTARETAANEADEAARKASNLAFAEGLIAAATLAPAHKAKVVGLLDQLDAVAVVSFGEGDGAEELTPNAAFRSLFDAAKPVIALGEHAPADKAGSGHASVTVSFAAPAGYVVDPAAGELHAKARELQAADPTLSFWDAVTAARRAG